MYAPILIRIINIAGHSDTTFHFVRGRVVMIKGENNYDKNPKSNGSGKSALLEGVSIAMTGEVIRKILISELIKDGAKSGSVEFEMRNDFLSKSLKINRTIYRQKDKASTLSITESIDGSEPRPVPFAKVPLGNDWILNEIGISKADLYNFYIISKRKYKSFFYSSDGDKRELISRFSNADITDGVYKEISFDVDVLTQSIEKAKLTRNNLAGRIDAYNEQLLDVDSEESRKKEIDLLNESIEEKKVEISDLEESIESDKESISAIEGDIKTGKKELAVLNQELLALKPKDFKKQKDALTKEVSGVKEDISELKASKKEAEEIIAEFNKELKELNKKESSINKELLDSVNCPKCKHEFMYSDPNTDLKKLKKELLTIKSDKETIESDINDTDAIVSELDTEIDELDTKLDGINKKIRNLSQEETESVEAINSKKKAISNKESIINNNTLRAKNKLNSITSNVESIKLKEKNIDDLQVEIEAVKNRDSSKAKKEIKDKILKVTKEIKEIDQDILDKEADKASKAKWNEIYKRFNIKLSNMAIKSIEGLSNDIQHKMGSNLSLSIDGYKIKRDGTVSDQITANVMRYGTYEGTFFRFSEGEQGTLNISATIAMQQLINMNCKSGGLDMMFIDEITESLDAPSIAYVIKALDMVGRTIAIITHVSDEAVIIPNEITIEKTSAGSFIKQ